MHEITPTAKNYSMSNSRMSVVQEAEKSGTRQNPCLHGFGNNLFNSLEKEMATHSSTLAWKIPWTEEPGRLQSIESPRVGHN